MKASFATNVMNGREKRFWVEIGNSATCKQKGQEGRAFSLHNIPN